MIKAVSLFPESDNSVAAKTTNTSAKPALVIKALLPLRTKPPSVLLANELMDWTSEPEPGSVKQNEPRNSPVVSLVRYFFFCSSVP